VSRLRVVPVELREANALVDRLHRHHRHVQGHRFSVGVELDGELVGAAIIGRPVARNTPPKEVLEVTRLVTDGTPHACSLLYAAAARAGKALGYRRIQTFILENEPGTSLRAAGWSFDGTTPGLPWKHTNPPGPRRQDAKTLGPKQRWVRDLNP